MSGKQIFSIVIFYLVVQISAVVVMSLVYSAIPLIIRVFLVPVIVALIPVGSTIAFGYCVYKKAKPAIEEKSIDSDL